MPLEVVGGGGGISHKEMRGGRENTCNRARSKALNTKPNRRQLYSGGKARPIEKWARGGDTVVIDKVPPFADFEFVVVIWNFPVPPPSPPFSISHVMKLHLYRAYF